MSLKTKKFVSRRSRDPWIRTDWSKTKRYGPVLGLDQTRAKNFEKSYGPWIPAKEINVTKIQIKMNKIIHYSKKTVPANAKENAGELLIKCNLEEMKKWSYIQISEIFDSQGNLKGHFKQMKGKIKSSNANDPGSRVDLIRGVLF